METMTINTKKNKEVINITSKIQDIVTKQKIKNGICHLFLLHTTAALTIADLDPGTDLDLLDALEAMIPKLSFRHPHKPEHAPDHIVSSIIGPSLTVIIHNGKITLGTWQEIVLVELDGPKERILNVSIQSLT